MQFKITQLKLSSKARLKCRVKVGENITWTDKEVLLCTHSKAIGIVLFSISFSGSACCWNCTSKAHTGRFESMNSLISFREINHKNHVLVTFYRSCHNNKNNWQWVKTCDGLNYLIKQKRLLVFIQFLSC